MQIYRYNIDTIMCQYIGNIQGWTKYQYQYIGDIYWVGNISILNITQNIEILSIDMGPSIYWPPLGKLTLHSGGVASDLGSTDYPTFLPAQ